MGARDPDAARLFLVSRIQAARLNDLLQPYFASVQDFLIAAFKIPGIPGIINFLSAWQKVVDFASGIYGKQPADHPVIFIVHDEDMVEAIVVISGNAAGKVVADGDAFFTQLLPGQIIDRVSRFIIRQGRTVDDKRIRQAILVSQILHNPLGHD